MHNVDIVPLCSQPSICVIGVFAKQTDNFQIRSFNQRITEPWMMLAEIQFHTAHRRQSVKMWSFG